MLQTQLKSWCEQTTLSIRLNSKSTAATKRLNRWLSIFRTKAFNTGYNNGDRGETRAGYSQAGTPIQYGYITETKAY